MPHPAEHRALRELHVFGRQLVRHWERLAHRLGGPEAGLLAAGAADARALLADAAALMAARDVPAEGAAAFAGRIVSARPSTRDELLERNQALRHALHDVEHVVTLLAYLAALAAARGDEELRALCAEGERRLAAHARELRDAVVALGGRPDEATAPAVASAAGRVGHRAAAALGAFGEWVDRRAVARRGDA
ncbi:MAG TPA: hypothetical protein VHF51_19705 [Solirubrobacteraceae bacterium]|nr:hypothetical protein [Solirubrobacteraceae bacterium]